MKLQFKILVLLVVVALFLPLWLRGPDGKPIKQIIDWASVPPQLSQLGVQLGDRLQALAGDQAGTLVNLFPGEAPAPPVQEFYRWQDQDGVWHFSDSPPPNQENLAAEALPRVSNSMNAVKIAKSPAADTGTPASMDSTITPAVALPEGVSKEGLEAMLQNSHERRMGEHL